MLCSLRIIHRDDAGIPTVAPSIIRVATHDSSVRRLNESGEAGLTDVTPHRSFVYRVVGPCNGVDELVKTG